MPGCCVRAGTGHTAALPRRVMNSRRFNRLNCIYYRREEIGVRDIIPDCGGSSQGRPLLRRQIFVWLRTGWVISTHEVGPPKLFRFTCIRSAEFPSKARRLSIDASAVICMIIGTLIPASVLG